MIAELVAAMVTLFLAAFGVGVLAVSMGNRLPTGPGSRGGRWHLPAFRRAYHRAWRAAHPEYREREKLRRFRERARRNGDSSADIETVSPANPRPLPEPTVTCVCDCGCQERVVVFCGWCRDGQHREETA